MRTLIKHLGAPLLAAIVATGAEARSIVIGGKNFTEQQLLAEMTAQYLDHLGYQVERRTGMSSTTVRRAQETGQVDLYWEYTGTSLLIYNKLEEGIGSPEAVYQKVKTLDAQKGLVWLQPSGANNTYALAMQRADAEANGITTLSELAQALNDGRELTLATNAEWYVRDDGFKALQTAYGLKMERSDIMRLDTDLTHVALNEGIVDIALVFATDGRIPAFDLVLLEDDKAFFPAYVVTPVVREEVLEANPLLAAQLNVLSARLDNDTLSALNARIDVDRGVIEQVAEEFLRSSGLR
ncbi:glycine betaine ABC transporter substrate-binding protein [Marinobacterium aestuariivivens]|uniref:Glycine betaine ABC transporter substrate-binding protein n=1 Tax=Marinobacterium aestuariivivens TaxID=1698799 RepID=A0ABW2A9N3_9GAMM